MVLQSMRDPGLGDRDGPVIGAFPRCWLSLRISTGKPLGHPLEQGKQGNHPGSTMGDQERGKGCPDTKVDIILP
jgi:hypothetical protein